MCTPLRHICLALEQPLGFTPKRKSLAPSPLLRSAVAFPRPSSSDIPLLSPAFVHLQLPKHVHLVPQYAGHDPGWGQVRLLHLQCLGPQGPCVCWLLGHMAAALTAVCCLQSAVCYQLSTVSCLLSAVCCLLAAVCCQLSAVCCLLSAVCSLLSAVVCSLLSAVCCLLTAVCCLLAAGCYLVCTWLLAGACT
jgi:uncharacterized Tic20 family protein